MNPLEPLSLAVTAALAGDPRGLAACGLALSGLASLWSLWSQWRMSRWPSVGGRVLAAGLERVPAVDPVRSRQEYTDRVSYEYVVDGRTFRGTGVSPWKALASHNARGFLEAQVAGLHPGLEVRVYYDPRNPAKSYLRPSATFGKLVTLAVAAALLSVPFLLFGH